MTRNKLIAFLRRIRACEESVDWAEALPARTSAKQAWERCQRGDWLLWLCGHIGIDRKLLVMTACGCAREALPHANGDEARICIETTEAWCRGEATMEHVIETRRNASYATAYTAADAAAASAAYATAYAAAPAADAADAYADAVARSKSLARSAEIVRERIPWRVVREAMKGLQ